MSPLSKRAKELYDEAYDLAKMLYEQGESDAERRYREVVAELLFLILDSLGVIRTLAFAFLGFLLGHLLGCVL